MKKIYLTLLTLLLTFWVLAEPAIHKSLLNDNPPEKKKKGAKKATVNQPVTATKSFTVHGGGNPTPGAQLDYSILLTANSLAEGVNIKDTLNENFSLVQGSLVVTPISQDDSYSSIGNVGLNVNIAAQGVLGNDISPAGKNLKAEAVTNGTTSQNGTYNLSEDGTFTYTPAVGFTGTDTFIYTLKDQDNVTANETGKVTITVENLIYFVNASVTSNGNGTLQAPFKTLSDITNTGNNPIFIYEGNYNGNLTLTNNQKIIGQGTAESLTQLLSIQTPAFSNPLPATNGPNPVLSGNSNCIILASNNHLLGLDVHTTGGTSILGTSVGNLKVRNVNVTSSNGTALSIESGGALDCIFTSISATNSNEALKLYNSTGSFEISGVQSTEGSGGTFQNITKRAIDIQNATSISLKNINFINASTLEGDALVGFNNATLNAALHFNNVKGITLDNIQMNTSVTNANKRIGINLLNSRDFHLSNSKILRNGQNASSAGILAINTSGINSITNTLIGHSARATHFINSTQNMELKISKSQFTDTRTLHDSNTLNPEGQPTLTIEAWGNTNVKIEITESDFLRYTTKGIAISASETATIDANIIKCTIDPTNPALSVKDNIGTGIDIASSINASVLFNIIENTVKSRQTHLINVIAKQAGEIEGSIEKNTVTYNYVDTVRNNIGSGIRVTHNSTSTTSKVKINENKVTGVNSDGSFGIDILANATNNSGRIDIINTNNTVSVGSKSLYAMRINTADGSQSLCAKIAGNEINAGKNGLAQIRSAKGLNTLMFEGNNASQTGTTGITNIWNNENTLSTVTGTVPNVLNLEGSGKFTFGNTCLSPSNTYVPSTVQTQNILAASTVEEESEEDETINYSATNTTTPVVTIQASNQAQNLNSDPQILVVNGSGNGFTIPENKSVTVSYSATIASSPTVCSIPNFATISGSNFDQFVTNTATADLAITSVSVPTASKSTVCKGESSLLSATCATGTVQWRISGDNAILSSQTSFSVSPSVTTTYEVNCKVDACQTDSKTITVNVNALPSLNLQPIDDICNGSTEFELSFSSLIETPTTYSINGPGILSKQDQPLPTSPLAVSFINPAIQDSTYSFTLILKNENGCSSEPIQGTVSIYSSAGPDNLAASSAVICIASAVTLTADNCAGNLIWYNAATHTALSGNQPTVTETTSYYAKCETNDCISEASDLLTVTLVKPTSPTVADHTVCNGSDLTLSGACASSEFTLKWFTDSNGTNEINPVLTNVSSPATYYAACTSVLSSACQSQLVEVKVYIEEPLNFNRGFDLSNYVYACENGNAEIILDTTHITGTPYKLQWQKFNGTSFADLAENSDFQNVTKDTLKLNHLTLNANESLFRVKISNLCSTIFSDTSTLKINQLPVIINQPVGQTVCVGNQTTLTVVADGSGLSYQWQVNTGSGFANITANSNYANVNKPSLTISDISNAFNNYSYRCVIFNSCQSINSNAATIVVDPTISILSQPSNRSVCQGGSVSFTVNAANTQNGATTYQWQRSTDGGVTYSNITASSLYGGVTTKTLSLSAIPASLNNVKFRCVINGYCQTSGAQLTVTPIATVTSSPKNVEICEGTNASFTVQANGINLTYRWQVNTGSGFVNINDGDIYQGATESTLRLFAPSTETSGYLYRCLVWGNSTCDTKADTSAVANLYVGVSPEAFVVVWNSTISENKGASQAVGYILGNNKITQPNGKAQYLAGQAVILEPGFEVESGAVFEANIKNTCRQTAGILPQEIRK